MWPFHRHIYEVIGIRSESVYSDLASRSDLPVSNKTKVLYRCDCGKLKVKKINGFWTLEQIKGKEC